MVGEYLSSTHSDPGRGTELEIGETLMKLGEPTIKFADKESSWKEVNDFLKRARAGSAPGPNGIPYKV